jgi:hypothetical protein
MMEEANISAGAQISHSQNINLKNLNKSILKDKLKRDQSTKFILIEL